MSKTTILIIDDHPLFREGLKAIITKDRRFNIVGEAGTGRDGLDMIGKVKPEVALVDISLPDENGMQLTRKIRGQFPKTQILIVSMHAKIEYIVKAFQAGATGYVVKESAAEGLIQGIDAVSAGKYFLDACSAHEVVENLMGDPVKKARPADSKYGSLTPREQEIIRMLAEGNSKNDIAKHLYIAPKTVENHKTNIMKKLDIRTQMELFRYAAHLGLIDVDLL